LGGSLIAVQTYILDLAPTDKKATFISIANMMSGLSVFLSSTAVGFLLQAVSGSAPPTLEQVGALMMVVFVLRFILWFSYFIIEDTKEFQK
jgi:MFS family permease